MIRARAGQDAAQNAVCDRFRTVADWGGWLWIGRARKPLGHDPAFVA